MKPFQDRAILEYVSPLDSWFLEGRRNMLTWRFMSEFCSRCGNYEVWRLEEDRHKKLCAACGYTFDWEYLGVDYKLEVARARIFLSLSYDDFQRQAKRAEEYWSRLSLVNTMQYVDDPEGLAHVFLRGTSTSQTDLRMTESRPVCGAEPRGNPDLLRAGVAEEFVGCPRCQEVLARRRKTGKWEDA